MIYLVDATGSHIEMMRSILAQNTTATIIEKHLGTNITIGMIARTINELLEIVLPDDIVFCPWQIPYHAGVDNLFSDLSLCCRVIASAGNSGEDIAGYTPTSNFGVTTVGSLNKQGHQASHSGWSTEKPMAWAPGTNIMVDGVAQSGTSIAAALYLSDLINSNNRFS